MRRTLLCAPLLLLAGLPAQDPILLQAVLHPVTQAAETVRSMPASLKGVAVTADGAHWGLVYKHDGGSTTSDPLPVQDASRSLLLFVSRNGGQSWTQVSKMRTTGSIYGSLAVDPDGYTLHAAWYAWNGNVVSTSLVTSIYYSTYDTRTGLWAGAQDDVLVQGTSSNLAYSWPDIAVTPKGVVGVSFGCGRGTPAGWVGPNPGSSWLNGFLWKVKGGTWSAPHQVTLDGSGSYTSLQSFGEEFHMCYRCTTGGYGVAYRRFDAVAQQFGPEGELPVVPNPSNPAKNISNLYANNNSHVALFPNGDVCVVYFTGTSASAGGKHMYVVAPAGTHVFGAPIQIDDDPKMGWGNTAYWCHGVTRHGQNLALVYSLVNETYQNLYMRTLTQTGPLPAYGLPPVTLRQGTAANQFYHVNGFRELSQAHAGYVTYSDLVPVGPFTGGRATFAGGPAGTAVWKGVGCQGTLATAPRLFASALPAIGGTVSLGLAGLPASTAGFLFLGFNDKTFGGLPLPLDLALLGMPGCPLSQDVLFGFGYAADASGAAAQVLPVPNDPALAGLPAFWQSFVAAPGATPGGMVLTNGLSTVLR